ncbi:hypothetical protein Ae201684_017852 [Aphanomyces euteiches]|uniref:Uncharacterized protein n=1 Tax=Aphanomyces euteiches TaxID=100861 RepID=A0A6G0W7K8_9STRA|nr:hypothetical protein Ae201684_017852 [Aphanomyces euteiches]
MVTGVWRPISCVSISESKLYLLKGGMWRWYQIVVAFLAPIALLSNTYLRLLSSASLLAATLVCIVACENNEPSGRAVAIGLSVARHINRHGTLFTHIIGKFVEVVSFCVGSCSCWRIAEVNIFVEFCTTFIWYVAVLFGPWWLF